jgi:hypothetical protein
VFFREIGVAAPKVSAISVDHAGNDPTTPDSADGEVMLDIEVAGAVAPKSEYRRVFRSQQWRQRLYRRDQRRGARFATKAERDFDQLGRPGSQLSHFRGLVQAMGAVTCF